MCSTKSPDEPERILEETSILHSGMHTTIPGQSGVEEGYIPTEVVEGGEDAVRPSTPRQGTRDPDGVPGLVEPPDRSVDPVGVDGSFVLHEHSGVGSVRAGGSDGTPGLAGSTDPTDPWSGASAASVAQAVEAVTNWVQPQMQKAMPLPSEVNPWLRLVRSGPRPLLPVVLPFQ
eukprot:4371012-Amphidinium_carterae.1